MIQFLCDITVNIVVYLCCLYKYVT